MADDDKSKEPKDIQGQPLDRPNAGKNRTATDERDGKPIRGREDLED